MNHTFKLVWKKSMQRWVAVPEITKSATKGSSKTIQNRVLFSSLSLLALNASLVAEITPTSVVPTGGKTNAYVSANGVPVVNIETANANGLSHNKYTNYNVENIGLVLNNGNNSQVERASQLAGQVTANLNLVNEASVILNEVVSTKRSLLNGFTEVVGSNADVIVANPNGISCNGCGFINTDRVTLTTGTPNISSNSLTGFSVNSGDIHIGSLGVNATNQDVFDLLTKSIKIEGDINLKASGKLGITTGPNEWDYQNRDVTSQNSSTNNSYSYAIDSSALGGMYAGRITIKATEAGVGVKMLGNAAASADDFVITSSGKIELKSNISAQNDINITSTKASENSDIYLNSQDAKLSAKNDILIAANNGEIKLNEAELIAENDINLSAKILNDVSTTSNIRFASNDSNVQIDTDMNIEGSNWGANNNLNIQANNLDIKTSSTKVYSNNNLSLKVVNNVLVNGTLYAENLLDIKDTTNTKNTNVKLLDDGTILSKDLNIKTSTLTVNDSKELTSKNNMNLDLDNLTLETTSSKIMASTDGLGIATIDITNSFSNNAVVHSAGTLNFYAPEVSNSLTGGFSALNTLNIRSNSGNFSNYGSLYAGNSLDIYASNKITNHGTLNAFQGSINSDGSISLSAQTVVNNSNINASSNIDIDASTFKNEPVGGDSRAWHEVSRTGNIHIRTDSWYSFPDDYKNEYWKQEWRTEQYYTAGTPTIKPEIISGATLSIQNFDSVYNYGSILSSSTSNITGNSGSSFVNDSLALNYKNYRKTWERYTHYIALGPAKYDDNVYRNESTIIASQGMISEIGGGLYSNTLNASGFSLSNQGSPYSVTTQNPNVNSVLSVSLPSNPNGYYVTSTNPQSNYLIETNPLYLKGSSLVGSDYMEKRYGVNPDNIVKKLGDANYEAYLIKEQLVKKIGTNLINAKVNEATQMKNLMDNGLSQGNKLGLTYGQAPSESQLENLTEDIVWMVETQVAGQTVLAPVVYLSQATIEAIDQGAVIASNDANLDLEELSNTGGTISGKDSLTVKSKKDITNISGTIKGGDVTLSSTEGSIVNKTFSQGSGNENGYKTNIGNQASIEATNNLSLDAKKDITNLGANMSANNNVSLNAGENITFDTIEDKTTTKSSKSITQGLASGFEVTKKTTVNQIKSGLNVGGNIQAKSGKDITLAGTDANIKGDASLDAGNNLNIIGRENTVTTNTESRVSGLGVGGGIYGTTETQTDSFSSRNVGSELNIGGNANLKAKETIKIQGSKVNASANTNIEASQLKVLAGKNVDTSTSKTTTTTFMKIDPKGSSTSNSSDSEGLTLAETSTTDEYKLSQRSVASDIGVGGDLNIKIKEDVTLQGSNIEANGNVNLEAKNVNLLAAQNIEIEESKTETVSIGLYTTSESQTDAETGTETNADFSTETNAQANAEKNSMSSNASANASAQANASAGASASAKGSAKTSNTLDIARIQIDESESKKITNIGSTIKSGNNLKIDVKEKLKLVGSEIEAENNIDLKAKDMSFEAAQDVDYSKKTSSTTTVGLYADANAEGEAQANAKSSAGAKAEAGAEASLKNTDANAGVNASAEASAGASAEASSKAGVGIQTKNVTTTTEKGSSTAVVSGIKSKKGSISRIAENNITDVGTNIEAATNFNQEANTIDSLAAQNSQFSNTKTETTTARVGVYVEAGGNAEAKASAKAEAGADVKGENKAEAKASASASAEGDAKVGIEVSVDRNVQSENRTASQAVVSNIKVGGDINSKSAGKTTLQGTNIEAKETVNLSASSLDVKAAKDTQNVTTSNEDIKTRAAVNIGVGGNAEAKASTDGKSDAEAKGGVNVGVEVQAEYSKDTSSSKSTSAVVSNIAGGKININTSGSTTLEGTNLNSKNDINIDAKDLDYKAANDTFEKSEESISTSLDVQVQVSVIGNDDTGAKVGVDAAYGNSNEKGSNAVVGSLNSGGKININTKGDTRLEGTNISAKNDTNINAGGDVKIDAARNTFESNAMNVEASVGVDTMEVQVDVAGKFSNSDSKSSEAVTSNINTGGALNINAGKNAKFEGTNFEVEGDASIAAKNNVEFNAAKNTNESNSLSVSASVGVGEDSVAVNAGFEKSKESGTQSLTSSLNTNGNLKISAGNDAKFEGTELEAQKDAEINAGGNVEFKEARDESFSETIGVEVGVSVGSSEKEDKEKGTKTQSSSLGLNLGVGYDKSEESLAKDGSIKAGNNLKINAGKDANFVGTEIEAGNSAEISAKEDVNFKASESKSESIGLGIEAAVGTKTTKKSKIPLEDDKDQNSDKKVEKENSGSLSGEISYQNEKEQNGTSLKTGNGGLKIVSGNNINMQGTKIQNDGNLETTGNINKTSTQNSSFSIDAAAGIKKKTKEQSVEKQDTPEKQEK